MTSRLLLLSMSLAAMLPLSQAEGSAVLSEASEAEVCDGCEAGAVSLLQTKLEMTAESTQTHRRALSTVSPSLSSNCSTTTVFDVGLPRTGTSSASVFLQTLGFKSHHILQPSFDEVMSCNNMTGTCGFYETFGAGTSLHSAFEDVPTPWLSCALARRFSQAKFILTKRPAEDYVASAHYMLCRWVKPVCRHVHVADHLRIQSEFYGTGFLEFCDSIKERPALCDDTGRSALASEEWVAAGQPEKWRLIQQRHDSEVQRCVPTDRLLEVELGSDANAHQIHSFLGCQGDVPEIKKINAAEGHA